ncbi:Nuclear transport factor 2, eukaryote,NTF2-like domain [Cinara cedri]|uniref:Nuclear transport factor 2, eukaryote,NTF2-like domain n=1 Tax=Cinara cedri TaxID=506608 RepID=A0A5E4MGB2_9HEMI|nr:Nuclear transport factor 2, eukaryote,NTF2-like domain [Cinara cedri]
MENGSEFADPKCESNDNSRTVTTANQDPLSYTEYADRIGSVFSQLYYSVMRSSPEYAHDFYDVNGEYRTIYADGSTVVARTRNQVKSVLMRPTSESDYVIKSVSSMPCGGQSDGLLVDVTGERFIHTFVIEYRPEMILGYAIVVSLTRYVSTVPAADHQTPVTKFPESESPAITGSTSSMSLETRDNCSPNTAACNEPIPENVSNDITINDTVSEKSADIMSVPAEPDFSITATTNKEPDTAAENIRNPVMSSKNISIQEPAISITETVDITEHDIEQERNQKPDIYSEKTSVPAPASTNTAHENIEHKPITKHERMKKHLCNLVLFSAACWVVYRYVL